MEAGTQKRRNNSRSLSLAAGQRLSLAAHLRGFPKTDEFAARAPNAPRQARSHPSALGGHPPLCIGSLAVRRAVDPLSIPRATCQKETFLCGERVARGYRSCSGGNALGHRQRGLVAHASACEVWPLQGLKPHRLNRVPPNQKSFLAGRI